MAVAAVLLAMATTSEVVLDAPTLTPFVSVALGSLFATALGQVMLVFFGVLSPIIAVVQVGLDLALLAGVVNVTGGPLSPFSFLFCLIVLEAALALPQRATIATAVVSAVVLIATSGLLAQYASTTAGQVAAVLAIGFLAAALMGQAQRARGQLERLGNLHERVLMGLSSGILTTDQEGRVGFINPAGLAILKRDDNVIGLPLAEVSQELARLEPAGRDRGETEVRIDGRALVLGLSALPLYGPENTVLGHTLIFRDLTAIRAAEQQQRRNEQLATVGRLAANLAHEVRNPLGSVSGSIDMIAQSPHLAGDERQLITIIQREVERLNVLIGDFLEYARPPKAERVRCDLALLADDTVQMFVRDPIASRHVVERTGVASVSCDADPGQLRQVLINLLKNAVQASGPGARIEVQVEGAGRLTVWNPGPPIEEPDRLFEPFYTTKPDGTGLGLAVVQQLVRQNGGEVHVRHDGARVGFELSLPL